MNQSIIQDQIININNDQKLKTEERELLEFYILDIISQRGYNKKFAQQILNDFQDEIYEETNFSDILDLVMNQLQSTSYKKIEDQKIETRHPSLKDQLIEDLKTSNYNLVSYIEDQPNYSRTTTLYEIQCLICFQKINKTQVQELHCGHQFCKECIQSYCNEKIMDGSADQMICPSYGCFKNIDDELLRYILDEEFYFKMNRFRKIKQLASDRNIIWCPNPQCDSYVKKSKTQKTQKCNLCQTEICCLCQRVAHPNKKCNKSVDEQHEQAIKQFKIQRCYKCKTPIQKIDGCNHMTCRQCNYQFCWLCQEQYTRNHYALYNLFGCPGQQFSQNNPYKFPNLQRFIKIILLIILFPIILVFGIIVLIFAFPTVLYFNKVPKYQFQDYSLSKRVSIILSLFLLNIICIPISFVLVLLMIIGGILGLPYFIFQYIRWIYAE